MPLSEIERLVENHRVYIRISASDRRYSLELVQPLLVKEDCHVGEASVGPLDRKLAPVGRADAMRNVELDLVALGQGLDRMTDYGVAVRIGLRQLDNRHLEQAAVQRHGKDARIECAAIGALIGRSLNLGLCWKRNREGMVRVGIFHPVLGRGRACEKQ